MLMERLLQTAMQWPHLMQMSVFSGKKTVAPSLFLAKMPDGQMVIQRSHSLQVDLFIVCVIFKPFSRADAWILFYDRQGYLLT